jgi:hypothetical protein
MIPQAIRYSLLQSSPTTQYPHPTPTAIRDQTMSGPKVRQGLDSASGISASVRNALRSLEELIAAGGLSPAQESTASSHLARFRLWAGSLGAYRSYGSRSLQYRLRDAPTIRRHIISLLQDLNALLADCINNHALESGDSLASLTPDTETDGPGSPYAGAMPSEDVDDELAQYLVDDQARGADSECDQLLDGIGGVVDCLLRLSVAISNPAPHDQFKSRAGVMLDFYAPCDIQHVRDKFPGLDARISGRLGEALTQRRQYFKYRKAHHERLRAGLDAPPGFGMDDEGAEKTTVASSLPEHLKDASDWGLSVFEALDPRDDRSEALQTSYAPSTSDHDSLRVPPIPKEYTDGPFLCPFCQTMVSIDTRHAWNYVCSLKSSQPFNTNLLFFFFFFLRKQVFRDLRPYVCLADNCTTPHILYRRRHEWMRHARGHWKFWECPFDCARLFSSADSFRGHIHAPHGDKVSPGKVGTLEALMSRPDPARIPEKCPLYLESDVRPERLYESHVGGHLEQMPFFCLLPTKDQDVSEDGESEDDRSAGQGRDSDTDKSEEAIVALSVTGPPPPARVKVYELRDNDWFDNGMGFCRLAKHSGSYVLIVDSEDRPEIKLLELQVLEDVDFQRQQDTLIVWTEPSGTDMAMSFQEADGCEAVWNFWTTFVRAM